MANQAQATSSQTAQQQSDPYAKVAGTYSNTGSLTARLQWAADHGHLIAPATTCGRLPEGCSVSIAIVWLDPGVDGHDVGFGKFGLLKHALMQLSVAAGVAFDPNSSGRVDDGSDSYYCHWKAVGAWRHLDGSILPLVGDKEVDLREGSAQVERIYASAISPEKGDKQLMEMRAFISAHAQTKAELRAIRKGLGIRSYTRAEFERPWVVAKLMFTGQSDDPRIREANAAAIRNSMLGGAQALFGPPAGSTIQQPQLPMAHVQTFGVHHAPPPVALTRAEDDDSSPKLPVHHATPPATLAQPQAASAPSPAPAPAPTAARTGRQSRSRATSTEVFVAKFGRMKDKPITEWDTENLDWYVTAFKTAIDDPAKATYRDSNEAAYRACLAERERREGAPPAQQQQAAPQAQQPITPDFDDADRGESPDDY